MACQTCDHTMYPVGSEVFWCPRCGSIKAAALSEHPTLVDRVRALWLNVGDEDVEEKMRTLGLLESVLLPEYRGKAQAKKELG